MLDAHNTISLQLRKLEDWDILKSRRKGKNILYRLKEDTIRELLKTVKNRY